jgi:hypothetical protein
MTIPKFVWIIIWVLVVLVILLILKVNINVGSNGIALTQGLVH